MRYVHSRFKLEFLPMKMFKYKHVLSNCFMLTLNSSQYPVYFLWHKKRTLIFVKDSAAFVNEGQLHISFYFYISIDRAEINNVAISSEPFCIFCNILIFMLEAMLILFYYFKDCFHRRILLWNCISNVKGKPFRRFRTYIKSKHQRSFLIVMVSVLVSRPYYERCATAHVHAQHMSQCSWMCEVTAPHAS